MSLKCSISVGLYWVILPRVKRSKMTQLGGLCQAIFNAIALLK
jgi:hypothetical protein